MNATLSLSSACLLEEASISPLGHNLHHLPEWTDRCHHRAAFRSMSSIDDEMMMRPTRWRKNPRWRSLRSAQPRIRMLLRGGPGLGLILLLILSALPGPCPEHS